METNISRRFNLVQSTPQRVLVVEDDITLETIWEQIILRVNPFALVDWATSATQGTQLIQASLSDDAPYDLIICDIFLSGTKTGIDLWTHYHEKFGGKFILVSSVSALKVQQLFVGDDHPIYIQKPFNIRDAGVIVEDLLQCNRR